MINTLIKPFERYLPENNRLERIWKLAQVDFKKRYYNDYFGLVWALINPLFRMAIYYFVFTQIFTRKIENYHLYLFSGLILWMYFAESSKRGLSTLLTKRYLIENIVFNRLDLFYSLSMSVMFGLLFNLVAYVGMSLFSSVFFSWTVFLLPIMLLQAYLVSVSFGLILSTLNIYFKDINHLWDMVLLAGFWVTPIFFRGEEILERAPVLLYANPMSGIIINVRKVLLYSELPDWNLLLISTVYAISLYIIGRFFFLKYSHKAAEKL